MAEQQYADRSERTQVPRLPGPARGALRSTRGSCARSLVVGILAALLVALPHAALAEPAATADPIAALRAALEAARITAVDALSPRTFAAAVTALDAAERDHVRGRDATRIAAQVAASAAALAEATRLAGSTRQALPGFVEARAKAGRAKAHEWAPQAWARAAARFAEAAQRAERGDLDGARARAAEVEALMLAAELEAIQNEALAPARAEVAAAAAARVADVAPRTLADARRLLDQAVQEIARNRYDMVVPGELAQKAEYQARHARMLAETIAPLLAAGRDEHALENLLLEWEAPLVRLAADLGISPRFDQGYLRPLDDMQKRVRELRVENDRLRAGAGEQQQALAEAQLALSRAEAKLRFLERMTSSGVEASNAMADLGAGGGLPAQQVAGNASETGAALPAVVSAVAMPAAVLVPAADSAAAADSAPAAVAGDAPATQAAPTNAAAPARAVDQPAAAPAAEPRVAPGPSFAPDEAVLAQRGAYRTLTLTGLRFAVGAGAFDSSSRPLLERVCGQLAREVGATFMVEGHVDSSGNEDADLALSQDRANSVRAHLVQHCRIPQERVLSMGYAASIPVAANDSAQGRAVNRRIVIEIQPPTP